MQLPYNQCLDLIKEADVLLFRRPKQIYKLGWWIGAVTQSEYSHVGLAFIKDDVWYVLEYREFRKSRIYPLQRYLEDGADIDVYRVSSPITFPFLHISGNGSPKYNIEEIQLTFDSQVAYNIIQEGKSLLGKNYGWINIWKIAKMYIPIFRLFTNSNRENIIQEMVCSTFVAWCYKRHYIDLVPNVTNSLTTPADIARSSILNYLFSLTI